MQKNLQHYIYRWYNFSPKSVTKHLNFSLTIYCHSSEYTFSMQCLSLNMKSMVDGFIYRHVSRSVNLTHSHHAFLWFLSLDLGPIMMKVRLIARTAQYPRVLSMKACHIARGKIILLPWSSPITISTKEYSRSYTYSIHALSSSHHILSHVIFPSCSQFYYINY